MSAVGSIEHILKTAFHQVYEEDENKKKAVIARELAIERQRLAEETARKEELERIQAEEIAKKSKSKSQTMKRDPSSKLKSPKNERASTPPESMAGISDINLIEELPSSRFENLNLNEKFREEYNRRKLQVESDLLEMKDSARQLLQYLKQQQAIAKEEELLEEEELKRQGVIVGQHVPSLKSKLNIDRNKLLEYGKVSSNIIIASELIEQNKVNTLRRTGNMPITELAEERTLQRTLHNSKKRSSNTKNE